MTIRALFDLCEANGYALALWLKPDQQGYTMSIRTGRLDGASPRWAKRFAKGTAIHEAADLLAKSSVGYFTETAAASAQPPPSRRP